MFSFSHDFSDHRAFSSLVPSIRISMHGKVGKMEIEGEENLGGVSRDDPPKECDHRGGGSKASLMI